MAPPGIGAEVEGLHAVAAAAAAGRVECLYLEASRSGSLGQLAQVVRAAGGEVRVVNDLGKLATTTAPQGVVARCRALPLVGLTEAVAATHPAALVVLDHLEDARNVGAIARSALAAGMGGKTFSVHFHAGGKQVMSRDFTVR